MRAFFGEEGLLLLDNPGGFPAQWKRPKKITFSCNNLMCR